MSAPRNKSLTRIHAGDSIKKFPFKEELSYIPATLYRVAKQRSIPGLAVLPFRSATNDMSSTVSPHSREISPDALGSSTILKPDLLYKTMRANNVLKVDRDHTKVDFSKKSSDVSYLMETKPYLREQRINEHSAHMIKRSIDMLSPKNQSNTVEYSILNNSQYKDDKPISRRGRTNIYLEMKGFGKDKEDSAFSETLKKLKSPVTAETSPERKGTSNVNRSIDIDNNNVSRVLPKIIDASKLGSTIDIPDAADEIKDNFMTKLKKGAIVQKRAQNKHLNVPSGRKEVVTLSDWLGTMLEDMQKKKTVGISELFDQTQLIYTVGLEEIIRQVKLQCSERGQILEKIWEAYTDLFNKAVEVSKKEKKQLESLHMNEMNEFRLKYEKDMESCKQNIEELSNELDEKRSSLEQEMEKREFSEGKSERLTKDLFELKHELHVAQTEVQKLINTTILLKSERRATVRGQEQQQVQVAPVEEQITETEDETEEDDSFNRELLIKYKERFGFVESEKKDMETETADLEVYIKENARNEKELLDKSVQYEVDEMAAENEGETSEEEEEDSEQEDEEQSDEGSEKETQIVHSAQEMLEIQNLEEMKTLKDALHRMTAMELKELEREIQNRLSAGEPGKKSKNDKKAKKTKKRKNKDRQASPAGITKDDVIELLEKYQEDNVYPSLKEIPAEDEMIQFMLQYLKGDEQWKFQDLKHLVKKITKRKAHSLDLDHESLINEAELNSGLKSLTGDQLSQNIKTMSKQDLTKVVADVEKKLEEVINGTQQNSKNQELIALLKRLLEERSDLLEGGNQALFKKILEAYEHEVNQNMGLRIENKEQHMDLKDLESRYENNENRARHLERQIEEVSEKNQHLRKTNEKLTKILTKKRTLEQEVVSKKLQQLDSLMSGYTSGPGMDSKDSEDTTERERIANMMKGAADGSEDTAGNNRSQNKSPGKIKENIAEIIKMAGSDFEEDWSDSDEKTDRFTDREDKPKYLSTKTLSMFANQRKSKASVFVTKPGDGLTSKKIVRVTSINGESANNLLAKAKEKKNIKSSLTKASFLKFMCQFYVDKLKDTKKNQRTPLHVTVYESFMNKYGLKKVAETKCLQIYEAAIAFSESKRIMRFRELLGLGESVEVLEELGLYLTTLRQLDPSSGGVLVASNTQEKIFIGLEQAEAVTIDIFESKLDPKSLKEVLISLPKIKSVDRASRTVELEDFIDKLFYVQKNLKNTVKGFVREIFGATDLDNDETLQLFEFNILYKHVERDRYDKEQVRDLFFEHADMILTDGSNEPVISFNKFAWICLEMKLFSEEKQKIFARVSDASDPVQTVKDLEENLKQKLNELRLRFLKSKAYTPQIRNIMTKLYSSVKNPQKSRTIVWLSYRLLDEESKLQLLDHEVRMMLPKEFSIIQRFVDEIEGWLDNTHPTEI